MSVLRLQACWLGREEGQDSGSTGMREVTDRAVEPSAAVQLRGHKRVCARSHMLTLVLSARPLRPHKRQCQAASSCSCRSRSVRCAAPTPPAPVTGRIEKYIMRKAFDDAEQPYLPSEVLWRQKEQFSDGVGYSW